VDEEVEEWEVVKLGEALGEELENVGPLEGTQIMDLADHAGVVVPPVPYEEVLASPDV